jgi:hypothetical protein
MMLVVCVPMLLRRHDSSGDEPKQEVAALQEEIARLKAERSLEDRSGVSDG